MKQLATLILALSAASAAAYACGEMPGACTPDERNSEPAPPRSVASPSGLDYTFSDFGIASRQQSASQHDGCCQMGVLCSRISCTHQSSTPVAALKDNGDKSSVKGVDHDHVVPWARPADHNGHKVPSNSPIGLLPPDAPVIKATVLLI